MHFVEALSTNICEVSIIKLQDIVAYQIYPRSFQDSNGDGIGDIPGITRRLDYLKELGINLLWITPMYRSPGCDNGYDISDYYAIDPVFGTMNDFDRLVSQAKARGIGIMMDMVLNHTSSQHHWFQEALKGKDNPYHDYYIWKTAPKGQLPNNWQSKFGGSVWEYVPDLDEYYLHLYGRAMPDLNWENPKVRTALFQVMRFWADKGIAGFRLDVINNLSKDQRFPNDTFATPQDDGRNFYTDGPRIHEFLREINREVLAPYGLISVGELSSTTIENTNLYTNPARQELSMGFTFHHMKVDYPNGQKWALGMNDLPTLKRIISNWQVGTMNGGGHLALFWTNHDQPRALARFMNDDVYRDQSAQALAIIEFGLRGVPFVYQGEEIAMKDAYFTSIDRYQDAESRNAYAGLLQDGKSAAEALAILQQKSRENARLPMQWDDTANHGFSSHTPWLIPEHDDQHTVARASACPASTLAFYQELIHLRHSNDTLKSGRFELLDPADGEVFAYRRESDSEILLVVANFTQQVLSRRLPKGTYHTIIANYKKTSLTGDVLTLQPYEALILRTSK
ncbi:alpha,alpha-phosphotrehalase [Lacticaseibacillus daqingensis]|uniref:alpha,alpha-phosphotrehalase n=1 Tax=Lacticaseibacillus daqingensis TaxID=2486014 RepID=UPI000F7B7E28|nr:alpha,alpha-phosphotrehalase [Lacticaseibacillus daqingensis]